MRQKTSAPSRAPFRVVCSHRTALHPHPPPFHALKSGLNTLRSAVGAPDPPDRAPSVNSPLLGCQPPPSFIQPALPGRRPLHKSASPRPRPSRRRSCPTNPRSAPPRPRSRPASPRSACKALKPNNPAPLPGIQPDSRPPSRRSPERPPENSSWNPCKMAPPEYCPPWQPVGRLTEVAHRKTLRAFLARPAPHQCAPHQRLWRMNTLNWHS